MKLSRRYFVDLRVFFVDLRETMRRYLFYTKLHKEDTKVHDGINEEDEFRDEFRLMQNYPNPSADRTSVRLNVPGNGLVSMNIYDAAGRRLLMWKEQPTVIMRLGPPYGRLMAGEVLMQEGT